MVVVVVGRVIILSEVVVVVVVEVVYRTKVQWERYMHELRREGFDVSLI